jgi:hypothetical protein
VSHETAAGGSQKKKLKAKEPAAFNKAAADMARDREQSGLSPTPVNPLGSALADRVDKAIQRHAAAWRAHRRGK